MKNNLKLYVWEDVLSDYTEGIMFALANSAEEAREIILEKACEFYGVEDAEYTQMSLEPIIRDLKDEPRVFDSEVGFFVVGGG